jgi:hypothetical protein
VDEDLEMVLRRAAERAVDADGEPAAVVDRLDGEAARIAGGEGHAHHRRGRAHGRASSDARGRRRDGGMGRGPSGAGRPARRERAAEGPGRGDERSHGRRSGDERAAARVPSRGRQEPHGEQRADERDARRIEGTRPDRPGVGAGAETVQRRRAVHGEGEHVDLPPEPVADPVTQA